MESSVLTLFSSTIHKFFVVFYPDFKNFKNFAAMYRKLNFSGRFDSSLVFFQATFRVIVPLSHIDIICVGKYSIIPE